MTGEIWERDVLRVIHITRPRVAFAVLTDAGFGEIVVELEAGQSEIVEVNGRLVQVIRDYVN